ncbi:putative autophagy regulatory protein Atg2 [Aspergillus homomorphus CBS 101889]|uniref:Autophagy-related protein 2 n=1 Tax=Aspergillus homomorphus (strain CBS 101889) TaxID=1450537 RepID=A0A395HIG9_ASPHC|nr:autophagy regulatory protein Atg2 [Aspergillus homomorphus CBS 101889]RAL07416.1 autophagy regulatory protein Atg2 [Aspergillus homomorphus CBS 101889]
MAYFLPSFFQKRLLRYALSRLELVDTEALDLDSLGIRWGQRSTVELRDIGLRLEKLATLLHLPVSSELLSARVQYLKITVPADIYSSGIICQASGIDVHLKLLSQEACPTGQGSRASDSPHTASSDAFMPNPADLAQSFLEAEPKEEKDELQAAISSRSQVLQRTSTSISDDEEELGLGNETVSLPSFVAAFLKGVADRLQVQVDDISVRVDVEMKQDGPFKRQPEDRPDLITGVLSVGQVKVDAVSAPAADGDRSCKGRRIISLSDIDLALVSEPAVLANYSRFAAPPSPSTPVHAKASQPPSRASSPTPEPSSDRSSTLEMTRSTILKPSTGLIDPRRIDHNAPELEGSVCTYDGRFSDADTDEGEARGYGFLEESQNFADDDKLLDNPAYLDSVINSQIQDDEFDALGSISTGAGSYTASSELVPRPLNLGLPAGTTEPVNDTQTAVILAPRSQTAALHEPRQSPGFGSPLIQPTLPSPISGSSQSPEPFPDVQLSLSLSAPPSEADSSSSTSGSINQGDLSESRLFSHDEAQSMYMSAMSHGSTSRSFMPNMPGAWDSSDSHISRGSVAKYAAQISPEDGHEHDFHDETSVSTPKLTPQSEPTSSQSQSTEQQSPSTDPHLELHKSSSVQSSTGEHSSPDVARRFFSIDRIQVSIPSGNSDQHDSEAAPTISPRRESNDVLGESTTNLHDSLPDEGLLNSLTRSRGDSTSAFFPVNDAKSVSQQGYDLEDHIGLEIFSAEIQFDIAIGWLVVKVGQRILSAFVGKTDDSTRKHDPSQKSEGPQAYRISLDSFAIKFVDHVPGHGYPLKHDSSTFIDGNQEEVLLQAVVSGLKANLALKNDLTTFHLDVNKCLVGFAHEDLISFSEELKMRESTRDVTKPSSDDISLNVRMSSKATTVVLMTLPLQLNLNIQRLEEAVGWVGGLSTILELGSSISSSSSSKGPTKDIPKRSRGVHFESDPPPATSQSPETKPVKVNARIGGITLNVIGESHHLKLSTTAVKVVSRSQGLKIQIDRAKLSGPWSLKFDRDPPATVNLTDIRFEYFFAPEENDLDRLLALITPSKDKYDEDDDIMLDTLFRQRKQGSVLRVTIGGTKAIISRAAEMDSLAQLGDEISRLSNVAKYLPEDDRPGVLTLILVREFEVQTHLGGKVGVIAARLHNAEAAYISLPSLIAARIDHIQVARNGSEELVGNALLPAEGQSSDGMTAPVLMARFIADEMDPTIKIKLHGLRVEYSLPAVIAFLGLGDDMTTGDVAANMASSIANLAAESPPVQQKASGKDSDRATPSKPSRLTLDIRDTVLGLNPRGTPARGLVVLTNAKFSGTMYDVVSSEAVLDLRKASIMVIDDVKNVGFTDNLHQRNMNSPQGAQIKSFIDQGYVPICTVSSATATVKIVRLSEDGEKSLDVELRDDLLILETCADSTQTLISIVNGLQPPTPPSVVTKYRTEVLPIQDMLASFTGDAFVADPSESSAAVSPESSAQTPSTGNLLEDEVEYVSDFPSATIGSEQNSLHGAAASGSNELLDSFHSQYHVSSSVSELDFRDDHFAQKSAVGGTAHRWDSTQNTYGLSDDSKLQRSPLRVRVRDAHVIWNLFDGYDWQRTRDTISKAVKEVERKATERRARTGSRASPSFDEEEESVIGDCLFNSIYIGIPANKDPRELRNDINRNIDDLVSETGSYATSTTVTGATVRQSQSPSLRGKKLRLSRSKYHKMTFELKGVCADLVVFPPGLEETQSSLDVRVDDVEIFDHVPTSTWKKFATYMHEAGEKESGTSMLHLEILTVRPVPELAASEIVLKATLLPLRLHVDQDALDFICRFFEFRDDTAPTPTAPSDVPFLQRAEINAVPVKLDFKPKRVDYAGLRSGRTTEFMNFFVLDGADMVMRHVIIYGVSGFDKLGQTLNDIWMPDIKRNQLPGVLAGLAPIKSLVNMSGGVKDLVVVPMREYKKDGRIVRSIQKGAMAFGKTTTNELVKLGAKLAIGTQTVLQGAEDLLANLNTPTAGQEDDLGDDEDANKISLYADQPVGVAQGLRGGFRGLERDLLTARDAIVAVPGEVMESGSAKAAAKAVMKRAPTVILRPAIGVTKAVGQTLLGAGNTLDPSNRRKMEDKYKRH